MKRTAAILLPGAKKVVAMLLLALLLFNWFGYRLLINFIEDKANTQLETQLDENNFDESQLISLKIPVRYTPYYNNSTTFERVDGQIEIEGIQYKYVKRRIFNDSLEVLCIPNHAAMELKVAKNEFFKFSNDLPQEKKSPSRPGVTKNFSIDNYTTIDPFHLEGPKFADLQRTPTYSAMLTSCFSPIAEQPPDIL